MNTPAMRKRMAGAVGALGIAVAMVTLFEGTRQRAYLDSVGIATICIGHTRGVRMGDVATPAQCKAYLEGDIGDAYRVVVGALERPQPDTRVAALTSLTFNIGARAFLRSTALRKINAGDIRGGCDAILRFVYAGGRVLPGLVARRREERALCLEGLQ